VVAAALYARAAVEARRLARQLYELAASIAPADGVHGPDSHHWALTDGGKRRQAASLLRQAAKLLEELALEAEEQARRELAREMVEERLRELIREAEG